MNPYQTQKIVPSKEETLVARVQELEEQLLREREVSDRQRQENPGLINELERFRDLDRGSENEHGLKQAPNEEFDIAFEPQEDSASEETGRLLANGFRIRFRERTKKGEPRLGVVKAFAYGLELWRSFRPDRQLDLTWKFVQGKVCFQGIPDGVSIDCSQVPFTSTADASAQADQAKNPDVSENEGLRGDNKDLRAKLNSEYQRDKHTGRLLDNFAKAVEKFEKSQRPTLGESKRVWAELRNVAKDKDKYQDET